MPLLACHRIPLTIADCYKCYVEARTARPCFAETCVPATLIIAQQKGVHDAIILLQARQSICTNGRLRKAPFDRSVTYIGNTLRAREAAREVSLCGTPACLRLQVFKPELEALGRPVQMLTLDD